MTSVLHFQNSFDGTLCDDYTANAIIPERSVLAPSLYLIGRYHRNLHDNMHTNASL